MNTKNVTLILVAGGKGTRMGSAIPKQFLPLQGKPVIYYPIKTFMEVFPRGKVVLVLPQEHFSYANMLLQAFDGSVELTIVAGGETRFHSVRNGLKETNDGIVFIHDGVRPFADKTLFLRCYEETVKKGNAIPAIPVTDSIRQWDGTTFKAIERNDLRSIQTPQTFDVELIRKVFVQEYKEAFTDESTMLEHHGIAINLVEGSKNNIKITTAEDLALAEALLYMTSLTNQTE